MGIGLYCINPEGGPSGLFGWRCAAETQEPRWPIPELVQLNSATLY